MLSPRRLTVLRELAQRGSFTAAADALSYTQSAVSQQISALERETGALLVERDRKRARLTEAGEILLGHADAILGRIAHAERDLSAYLEARAGRLRLAAFESAGAALVPTAVEEFHARHPAVVLASLGKAAPVRRVYAARLATRHPAPASDAMLAVLQEVARRASASAALA